MFEPFVSKTEPGEWISTLFLIFLRLNQFRLMDRVNTWLFFKTALTGSPGLRTILYDGRGFGTVYVRPFRPFGPFYFGRQWSVILRPFFRIRFRWGHIETWISLSHWWGLSGRKSPNSRTKKFALKKLIPYFSNSHLKDRNNRHYSFLIRAPRTDSVHLSEHIMSASFRVDEWTVRVRWDLFLIG